MKALWLLVVVGFLGAGLAFGDPLIDGKVGVGEYAHTLSVLSGSGVLSWAPDASGGLSVAVSAKTSGWVAVGLGTKRMSGSTIYIGFVGSDGKAVFSEQAGKGHRHVDAAASSVDKSAVARSGASTVVEFHLVAGKLPYTGKSVPFIVAFGSSADLTTFHEDNSDSGTFVLP